jgi:hypothetical protein
MDFLLSRKNTKITECVGTRISSVARASGLEPMAVLTREGRDWSMIRATGVAEIT